MISALLYTLKENNTQIASFEELYAKWASTEDTVLWVNIVGKEADDTNLLVEKFLLNSLAVTDSLWDRHPPKFEIFESYIFIILRPLIQATTDNEINFGQLSVFLGDRYIITWTHTNNEIIKGLWRQYTQNEYDCSRSVKHIFYKIFKKIADEYMSAIIEIEESLDAVEDLFEKDEKDIYLPTLTKHNTVLRKIIRNLEYMEKVARNYSEKKQNAFNNQFVHELLDVYEQVERGLSLAQMYQSLCNDLINIHISITSHRVNKVVKTLTIVAVLFLPLSFIAGLYGMNFQYIPELQIKYGYFYVLGLMAVVEVFLIYLMKRLKWF